MGGRLTEAPDLIEPPAAREPAEVLLLACAALTDGDLEAAVALYEPDATLSWGQDHARRATRRSARSWPG